MFAGYWTSINEDITHLICHATSQDHMAKESWIGAPWGKSPPCQVVGQRHCGSGDTIFLVCHII